MTKTLSVSVLLLVLVSACAAPLGTHRVAPTAVDLNKVLEQTHNEIVLLNIVRASKHLPQHWSALTTLRDTETLEYGTGGIGIPFGGASIDNYSVAPSAKWVTKPGLEMAVQVSSEFTRGIMQPIDLQQLQYFLEQGWPPSFVFHLGVREISVTKQTRSQGEWVNTTTQAYTNRPDAEMQFEGYARFSRLLDQLLERGLAVAERRGSALEERSFHLYQPSGKALAALRSADFDLTPNGLGRAIAVVPTTRSLILAIDGPVSEEGDWTEAGNSVAVDASGPNERFVFTLVMRSPESLIYFLGQVLRAQEGSQSFVPTYGERGREHALFTAGVGTPDDPAAVSVEHGGQLYIIPPATQTDRSLMTFSFASLLINLNRSRKDLPTSSVIAISGN
ncbi:MAG: hypothetical protein ACI8QS_000480 [Planctomycetota bacterium]|jgi:hypothetical protein